MNCRIFRRSFWSYGLREVPRGMLSIFSIPQAFVIGYGPRVILRVEITDHGTHSGTGWNVLSCRILSKAACNLVISMHIRCTPKLNRNERSRVHDVVTKRCLSVGASIWRLAARLERKCRILRKYWRQVLLIKGQFTDCRCDIIRNA